MFGGWERRHGAHAADWPDQGRSFQDVATPPQVVATTNSPLFRLSLISKSRKLTDQDNGCLIDIHSAISFAQAVMVSACSVYVSWRRPLPRLIATLSLDELYHTSTLKSTTLACYWSHRIRSSSSTAYETLLSHHPAQQRPPL